MSAPALAIAVERTANRKLGDASTTHASQISCPASCPFYTRGCYAETGMQNFVTRRLNAAEGNAAATAATEAAAIGTLSGTRPLRLHTVGDCATPEAARMVSSAADAYRAIDGQPVWTYTHAWRDVPRDAWGTVSVLASCETEADVQQAQARGYATALVAEHRDGKRAWRTPGFPWYIPAQRYIPCPQQTSERTCSDCRLCFDDTALRARNATIVFSPHGSGAKRVRAALTQGMQAGAASSGSQSEKE
jgi:hypothetical protein